SARITDASGQPMANAQVQALSSSFQGELRILVPVQQVRTNEFGEYRLYWLRPGRYYIDVVFPGWPSTGQLIVSANPTVNNTGTPGTYTSTSQSRPVIGQSAISGAAAANSAANDIGPIFFPSTPDRQSALPVDVKAGGEYRGMDIHVVPIRKFNVCGVVVVSGVAPRAVNNAGAVRGNIVPVPLNPIPDPCSTGQPSPSLANAGVGGGSVQLAPLDIELRSALSDSGNRYNSGVDGNTGKFIIRNVLPGTYDLSTFISGMGTAALVEVRDHDVDNLVLTLSPGNPLPTHVVVEGSDPKITAAMQNMTIVIGSDPPSQGTSPNSGVSNTGTFVIANVGPKDTRVYVLPLLNSPVTPGTPNVPDALKNAYVKSAKLGDKEVLNSGLRFGGETGVSLEIVIGSNPGVLTGRVVDDRNQPSSGVFVTLIPEIATARLFRTDMYKTSSTDTSGQFEVRGLPPGDYRAFAWEGWERNAWLDPDFFKPYQDKGRVIHVDEGKTANITDPLALIHP
ncbi:MAG TPA: carboxypeptidase-like regulatory domain-containing protein, partial [Terriglobia bacterium]|nr:carboxypeptidase-like regulatory domain-containing protein [Terriglobia bacterium]